MTVADSAHDQRLEALTHPHDWVPPTPADRYDLVVVGGGPAGLVAALGAAGLGARVALVEKHLLGGDCLVTGCVPSKAVLRVAHAAGAVAEARSLGLEASLGPVDFAATMERMRAIRAGIAPHDSAERLAKEGVDVFLGAARFTGTDRLAVGDHTLVFRRCCIATGAHAACPPIPGLDTIDALTNDTLFDLTERPARLLVVGAGVIGCEMAQAFARLGSAVTVVDPASRVLFREDPDASAVVQRALVADGVTVRLGLAVERFAPGPDGAVATLSDGTEVVADRVLLAVGRTPNLDLDLAVAGVQSTPRGIEVDARLRTHNPRIYAAGDVIGQAQLTHAADHQARIVIGNALFFGRRTVDDLVIPRVTYTHPELASVGTCDPGKAASEGLTAYTVALSETDRGRTDGDEDGFLKLWADGRGRIHGATVVGPHAGELLAPVTLAMTHGLGLPAIASTIHAYPTRSELLFKAASAYQRQRVKPWMRGVVRWFLGLVRR